MKSEIVILGGAGRSRFSEVSDLSSDEPVGILCEIILAAGCQISKPCEYIQGISR
jgi:hypothetical protein